MFCDWPNCSYLVESGCGRTWENSQIKEEVLGAVSEFPVSDREGRLESKQDDEMSPDKTNLSDSDEAREIAAGIAPVYERLRGARPENSEEVAPLSFSEEREKAAERIAYLAAVRAEAFSRYSAALREWEVERENTQKYHAFLATDSAYKKATEALAAADFEAKEKGFLFVSSDWQYLQKILAEKHVDSVTATRHEIRLTEEEIIRRISGGDKTGGSCVSVGFAYIANKMGLDVLDFRGGESREAFCRYAAIKAVAGLGDIRMAEYTVEREAAESANLLTALPRDREYYFVTGRHAAIVRNTDRGAEYLELQSPKVSGNGWKVLGRAQEEIAEGLARRFGCKTEPVSDGGRILSERVLVMDVESFAWNPEFEKLAEYFNTNVGAEQKGVGGRVK